MIPTSHRTEVLPKGLTILEVHQRVMPRKVATKEDLRASLLQLERLPSTTFKKQISLGRVMSACSKLLSVRSMMIRKACTMKALGTSITTSLMLAPKHRPISTAQQACSMKLTVMFPIISLQFFGSPSLIKVTSWTRLQ